MHAVNLDACIYMTDRITFYGNVYCTLFVFTDVSIGDVILLNPPQMLRKRTKIICWLYSERYLYLWRQCFRYLIPCLLPLPFSVAQQKLLQLLRTNLDRAVEMSCAIRWFSYGTRFILGLYVGLYYIVSIITMDNSHDGTNQVCIN